MTIRANKNQASIGSVADEFASDELGVISIVNCTKGKLINLSYIR